MRLDVDKELPKAIECFGQSKPSIILDHGEGCCTRAREWFVALDNSFLVDGSPLSGPRWIRMRWNWGPVTWPLCWCQIPHRKALDCGALASLARMAFMSRGLVAFPVQLVQQFSAQDVRHWRRKWEGSSRSPEWTSGNLAYHEASAVVVRGNRVKIWDPTDCLWIRPAKTVGYAATVAVCFDVEGLSFDVLEWEGVDIYPNVWIKLGECDTKQ